jgi:hypothetical protein
MGVEDRVKECGRDTEWFLWFTPAAMSQGWTRDGCQQAGTTTCFDILY